MLRSGQRRAIHVSDWLAVSSRIWVALLNTSMSISPSQRAGDDDPNHWVYDCRTLHLPLNRTCDLPEVKVCPNRYPTDCLSAS